MSQSDKEKKGSLRRTITGAPRRTMGGVVSGGLLSSDFFYRHKLKIFVALVLVMIYIATKYQCMTGMESIRRLENRLEVVKTERIRERSRYMSRIRESSMAAIADSIRPGLSVQNQPPYTLHFNVENR